jgi:antitoxin MazE
VNIQVLKGRLIIEPVSQREYSLDELLSGITSQNCHTEIDTGAPVGMEIL